MVLGEQRRSLGASSGPPFATVLLSNVACSPLPHKGAALVCVAEMLIQSILHQMLLPHSFTKHESS